MKKASDMTAEQFRAAALRCPIRLKCGKGAVKVPIDTGDWFCYPAKTEISKRYRRAAIEDLRKRELGQKIQTLEFSGPFGRVRIGGRMFSLFPKSGMLVRDDFADWAERHFDEFWDSHLHRERLPERDTTGVETRRDDHVRKYRDVRKRAMALAEPTDLLGPGEWNDLYDMKHTLSNYALALDRDKRLGAFYVGTKLLADHLATTIAYREKHYADAAEFALDMAADALRMAQFITDRAAKEAGTK